MSKKDQPQGDERRLATIEQPKTGEVQISDYRLLNSPPDKMVKTIQLNAGPQGIRPFDLDRVRIPSGGGLAWEVPTLDGPKPMETIEGIIMHWKDVRAFWKDKYGASGGTQPPDCASPDGFRGYGNPGGECATCRFNQFGSAVDDKGQPADGKACKEARMMFLMQKDNNLPAVVTLPPTSLKPARQYFQRLSGLDMPYYALTTKFTLVKERNKKGTPYSQAKLMPGRRLNDAEKEAVEQVAATMRKIFDRATAQDSEWRAGGSAQ